MDLERGTERGPRRDSVGSAPFMRQVLERMAAGDVSVPLDELRRHLSQAEQDLARLHDLGGRYLSVQMSPHVAALYRLQRARRKAG